MHKQLAAAALVLTLATAASASTVNVSALDVAFTQNFNTQLAQSGTTGTVTPIGWYFSESGANANASYGVNDGGNNAGNTYSYGSAGSSDRAFGGLRSGSLIPIIGAAFTNNTGEVVTSLDFDYFGEQWRLGATGRTDRLDFQYSTSASSLTTGTWIDFDELDFIAPNSTGTVGALDGNSAANRRQVTGTISGLSLAPGAVFWIRWTDFDAAGADDGLAIDDFSITARGAPPVAEIPLPAAAVMGPGLLAAGLLRRRR